MKRMSTIVVSLLISTLLPMALHAEVMLQWFETNWEQMYRRLPEAAEVGYDFFWIPPPTKGPTGEGVTWANVGYNLYDRFDLGQVPQRGSLGTRYGTLGDLNRMVEAAHAVDIKIIPDIVINHNGNGPDFREYPGMVPEDFHVQWSEGYVNNLNYMRGPRMDQWTPDGGYGATMWMELAQLIDIRTEDNFDPSRFTAGNNTPDWNLVAGTSFLRHPGQYNLYPYNAAGYGPENAPTMLNRWIAWLGDTIDYDGLRLDAGKHTPYEFFGTRGSGFLHEAQYNYNYRRGYTDSNADEADELFENYYAERDDALIFAEILSPWSEIEYWYGYGSNTRNPMRFLDYGMKKEADDKFNGDMNGLGAYGSDFGPNNGIAYVWGHDEGGPSKINLAYAYILTHVGLPMVYFTGNNISWDDYGREAYPNARTWMIPGYDSQALGDEYNDIPNLVYIHQQFARGSEWKRWENDSDFFALERYDDMDSSGAPDLGEGLLLMALNDSGWDQSKELQTAFPDGTTLHDYTGHGSDIVTYSGGKAYVTVPANGGQGWVCYAPQNAEGTADTLQWTQDGSPCPTMTWIVPGGVHASDKTRTLTRITGTNITLNAFITPSGGTVDSTMMKWGRGVDLTANYYNTNRDDIVSGFYEVMDQNNSTNFYQNFQITEDNIPEGLNVVKVRAFNQRTSLPALFNTFTEVVYVDRRGPEIDVSYPADSETIQGEAIMIISNVDRTAYGVTVAIDGGSAQSADEVMTGLWKYELIGLSAGAHSATIIATEADWDEPRNVINASTNTRNFSVAANAQTIALNHSNDDQIELPFFSTAIDTGGGSPDAVRLYWDGYRLPVNGGNYTNIFNGEVIYDGDPANVVTDRLWGAFVNGPHFFEAERVDGGVTSRVVRRVVFNLYGNNLYDTDGDGLPDNVEMPYFDDGAPGPDQAWPGDDNDFIPEWGETWTRLNVYNHSTYYNGTWDNALDSDGDGINNGDEVLAGYYEDGNVYKYDIYDASSTPTGTPTEVATVAWSPDPVNRDATLSIDYTPNDGPLNGAGQVVLHVGHSGRTETSWQDVIDTNMSYSAGKWSVSYTVPTNATSVDFTFFDGDSTWDGRDFQASVVTSTGSSFQIDGVFNDGANNGDGYTVFPDNMKILAAVKGEQFYIATWGVSETSGGNDHFLYVTDELGDASDPAPGWNKQGYVFMDTANKPYLTAEGENDWEGWNNVASGESENGAALEGEINLIDAFGYIPDYLYVASVAYGTGEDGIVSQSPYVWDAGDSVEPTEFLRLSVDSIRDENGDGYYDAGQPQMWTVVGNNTNDANYGIRRFFINELANEEESITVILEPNAGTGNTLSNVELFSNLNRRDYAVMPGDEDPDSVTTSSATNYYRAYAMTDLGGGRYSYTLPVRLCGAYRITARYKINGGDYIYYTDNGQRRDCAVVVSPTKAHDVLLYELNPLFAEATSDDFSGRSTFADMVTVNTDRVDTINTSYFTNLGVNMVWLQPIHPIGAVGREDDPDTGSAYDPGSPYAVRNYWKVNNVLGDPSTETEAMSEFQTFVEELDGVGVGVMLDGTFNHSAWDCEIGSAGVEKFAWATDEGDYIRAIRPQWYSKYGNYGEPASYYESLNNTDIAPAPDRMDFGKWNDAADFYFGTYDALVQGAPSDTNWAWSSAWYNRYLFEEDRFDGFATNATRELWEYFSYYPEYWLEKTGHPRGTPKDQSYKGIDGLRCDFAQGLPSAFWEYTINRTRAIKWDFLFMAESLDGYREVNGSTRHGVGYRSSRHFDILNENMVFYWRDQFFNYYSKTNANPDTYNTWKAFDDRRNAFDQSPILLNLSSHDEIYPEDVQWRLVYAYATLCTMDGVPMLMYGQEAGAQNSATTYTNRGIDAGNNFAKYEINFGKAIANFKRYNHMTNIWNNINGGWADNLLDTYSRVGWARLHSPALRSLNNYMLTDTNVSGWNPDIFAVAKVETPGVDAGQQDVVFAVVNNNYEESTNRWATYDMDADYNGQNYFGINGAKSYNLVDLLSDNPTNYVWQDNRSGESLINDGITVGLTGNPYLGEQAQYLKLVDVNATYPADYSNYRAWDWDNDGLDNDWEIANNLDPHSAVGTNGPAGDADGDGFSNGDERLAGTAANDDTDYLWLDMDMMDMNTVEIQWPAVTDKNYGVERSEALTGDSASWQQVYFGTALNSSQLVQDATAGNATSRFYRVYVKP